MTTPFRSRAVTRKEFWSAYWKWADLFLLCGHGTVDGNEFPMETGELIEAKRRFPELPYKFAQAIQKRERHPIYDAFDYWLLVSDRYPKSRMGLFQVSYECPTKNTKSDAQLIQLSVTRLRWWCQQHPKAKVVLELPKDVDIPVLAVRAYSALPRNVMLVSVI